MQEVKGGKIPFLLRYRMHVYENSPQILFRNRVILGLKALTKLQRTTDIMDRTKLLVIKEPRECICPCSYKLASSRRKSVTFGWLQRGFELFVFCCGVQCNSRSAEDIYSLTCFGILVSLTDAGVHQVMGGHWLRDSAICTQVTSQFLLKKPEAESTWC